MTHHPPRDYLKAALSDARTTALIVVEATGYVLLDLGDALWRLERRVRHARDRLRWTP